eukprot:gnl/TRDRNA2_/TRDRNA2_181604_c0_seq1.p1 gnl/TRDRNA2_/TRDRNA2_181604_c0~~gnl/TRDRNA2_/TRDRNA2_181604_c0_seq1.p1  ORF type:complete len:529 (-),score=47.02 gnl/TRDRNA2_/TRDRNA2_181604_c0_seq1:149-1735(-)
METIRLVLLAFLGTYAYTGAIAISTDDHCKGNDEVGLLQVKVEAKNEKFEEASLMNSQWGQGAEHKEGNENEDKAAQEAMVAASEGSEAVLNNQGDAGLSESAVIWQEGHHESPAEMLLKNIESLSEDYDQPAYQALSAERRTQVTDFQTAINSILQNLQQNRANKKQELDGLLADVGQTGNFATSWDLAGQIALRNTEKNNLITLKSAADDCSPSSQPPDVNTECDAFRVLQQTLAGVECTDQETTAGTTSIQICNEDGKLQGADGVLDDTSWETYANSRASYCANFEETVTSDSNCPSSGRSDQAYCAFEELYASKEAACSTEESSNTARVSSWDNACPAACNAYHTEYCIWRTHWIEMCTVHHPTEYNRLYELYLTARNEFKTVLDLQWNAEFVAIQKILCFLDVWLGAEYTVQDTHQHETVEHTTEGCRNISPDITLLDTQAQEGITADLRSHRADITGDPALPACDYQAEVDDASWGYPDDSLICGTQSQPFSVCSAPQTEVDLVVGSAWTASATSGENLSGR